MKDKFINRNNLLYYASVTVAFILPFGSIQLVSYSLILLSVAWLIHEDLGRGLLSLKRSKFFILFAGLYFLYLIGLLYSQNLNSGLKQLEITFSLLLMPLIFGSTPVFNRKQVNAILISFVLGNLIVGSFLLAYNINKLIVLGRPIKHLFHYDIYYSFTDFFGTHSVYYSMYLVFCIAFIIIYLYQHYKEKSIIVNILITSIALFFLFLILVMASRIQIFILFLIINILIIWISKSKIRAIITVLVLNVLLVTAIFNMRFTYYQYLRLVETELNSSKNSKGDKRLSRWIASGEIIKDNFLIGVGTGDANQELVAVYKKNDLPHASEQKYNAHNQYLEIFITLGFLGLLYFLATLIIPLFMGLSANQKVYIIFLIIIMLSFLTESMLNRQQGVVFYAFFNSMLAFNLFDKKLIARPRQG